MPVQLTQTAKVAVSTSFRHRSDSKSVGSMSNRRDPRDAAIAKISMGENWRSHGYNVPLFDSNFIKAEAVLAYRRLSLPA